MPVKTIYAPSLSSGLRAVKEAFGEDAVILSTRRIDSRERAGVPNGAVEIVASDQHVGFAGRNPARQTAAAPARGPAAPHAAPARKPAATPAAPPRMFGAPATGSAPGAGSAYLLPPIAQRLHRHLCRQGLEAGFVHRTLEALSREAGPAALGSPAWFEARVREVLLDVCAERPVVGPEVDLTRVLAVTGPSGVGKSSIIAKISSIFWLERQIPVALAVLQDPGEPSPERLILASQIMGMPLYIVENIEDLSELAAECSGKRQLLVDVNLPEMWSVARPKADRHMVLAQLQCIEIHLALSGGAKTLDLVAATRGCQGLKLAGVGFTRMDETGTVGSVFENARRTRVPLSFLSNGRRIPEDFSNGGRRELIDRVLQGWR